MASSAREPIYSAEQIKIPPQLPEILKDFAKHIIRTQPTDILKESAEYFTKQAALNSSPRKSSSASTKLSELQLESIYNRFGSPQPSGGSPPTLINRKDIQEACEEIGIGSQVVADIITLGAWGDRIPWLKFWALSVAAGYTSLIPTLHKVASILSGTSITKPEPGVADDSKPPLSRLPTAPFKEIFTFLAERDDGIGPDKTAKVLADLGEEKDVELSSFLDKLDAALSA
ncbi:hypothetical protein M427DRAFT_135531 [Gonapodya prolifera JEL478]|uniref:RIIa domain-containing protein n=1 Tax=Gonapodya prolifera (strain JEL478) TaxID=1344416 RepID=A0A139ADV7_GONPJ|nr:hypothetical protein M427DRAFT_135531 [Gonapodya prolifera JEL478]|eukprot:KXS14849.1 hypothetical protein M427DRAFT_135531 [Gonapodya prolifera JEL478]